MSDHSQNSEISTLDELYRVKLAFKAIEDHGLPTPIDISSELHIERDGVDYLATMKLLAPSAQEAMELAERALDDFLACMAARAAPYAVVHDGRRNVGLVDPEPVREGPIPPFQCVGGVITAAGAEALDPTGELRRQRRVFNFFAKGTVSFADISQQSRWYAARDRWSERLQRALALLHAAECAQTDVRFVLTFFAFEVLTSEQDRTLLSLRKPIKADRRAFQGDLQRYLEGQGYDTADVLRWVNSVVNTHARSPIDLGIDYVIGAGENITAEDLKWLRDQRSAYVHSGVFDRSTRASQRREEFRQLVRNLVVLELDALP